MAAATVVWKVVNPKDATRDDIAMYSGRTVEHNALLEAGDYTVEATTQDSGLTPIAGAFRYVELDVTVTGHEGGTLFKSKGNVNPKEQRFVAHFSVPVERAPAKVDIVCTGHSAVRSIHFKACLLHVPLSLRAKGGDGKKAAGPVDDKPAVLPKIAWKRKLNATFPDHREFAVSAMDAMRLSMLGLRMKQYIDAETGQGRLPVMNPFKKSDAGPRMGVPLGGIGAGTIGRGWRGEFGRWSIIPGFPNYSTVDANQFSVFVSQRNGEGKATVLSPLRPKSKIGRSWNFGISGTHSENHSLYPQSWTEYKEPDRDVKLTCRQVSPFIPHNYRESSFPMAVFEWTVENTVAVEKTVSLMFSWQNGMGEPYDMAGGHENKHFSTELADGNHAEGIEFKYNMPSLKLLLEGVIERSATEKEKMEGEAPDAAADAESKPQSASAKEESEKARSATVNEALHYEIVDPFSMAICATSDDPGATFFHNSKFVSDGSVKGEQYLSPKKVWDSFELNGTLSNSDSMSPSQEGQAIAGATAVRLKIPGNSSRKIVFSLAWDNPVVRFNSGAGYFRRYTNFYGRNGRNAQKMATDALEFYKDWIKQIDEWQKPILQDANLPDWYKLTLFNELYYIVEGGSIWTAGRVSNDAAKHAKELEATPVLPEKETYKTVGKFGYLESLEYIMVNTYDVHFYASWALAMLFPLLEQSLQIDFCEAMWVEYDIEWQTLHSGEVSKRKVTGAVPHDLGNPGDSPWDLVNSYCIQPINCWKDLNCKLVLQVWRDYQLTGDVAFLRDCWASMQKAIQYVSDFDTDGDGLIENQGFPDQTYDTWAAMGPSAYSGGLWVTALAACAAAAKILNNQGKEKEYQEWHERAKRAYHEKLWSGEYYLYDASESDHFDSIQADSMCGQWWARGSGLPSLAEDQCVKSSLRKIFDYNVKKFKCGQIGPVNGMKPDGRVDTSCLQSVEVWTGTAYGLAATMMQEGMVEEAFSTAKGIYRVTYETVGYMFQTPEAWDDKCNYRALSYMRPLSIWGMQYGWEKFSKTIRPHPNRDLLEAELKQEIEKMNKRGGLLKSMGVGSSWQAESSNAVTPTLRILFVGHEKSFRTDLFLACWQRRPVTSEVRAQFQDSTQAHGSEELAAGGMIRYELFSIGSDDENLFAMVQKASVVVCSFSVTSAQTREWVENTFCSRLAASDSRKPPVLLAGTGIEIRDDVKASFRARADVNREEPLSKEESKTYALDMQTKFPFIKAHAECSTLTFKGFRTLANTGLQIVTSHAKVKPADKPKAGEELPEAGAAAAAKMRERDEAGCIVM
mmetsp:Transcript_17192/g.48392  ORF Transcript_17192/g.48392 Transcript_17192/m.48392 type:complete len:1303 (+) Transcript_17192:90-3998(+)